MTYYWAVKISSENHLDGYREHFSRAVVGDPTPALFHTREEAREYAKRYAYIRTRPDLRREPHGWKAAKVVMVVVKVIEI